MDIRIASRDMSAAQVSVTPVDMAPRGGRGKRGGTGLPVTVPWTHARFCSICSVPKPLAAFDRNRTQCTACRKRAQYARKRKRMAEDPAYAAAVRAKDAAAAKRQRAANPEVYRRIWRESKRRNPSGWDKTPAGRIARQLSERARRKKMGGRGRVALGRHSMALLELQRWRCAACGADLRKGKHLDHVVPIAAGGKNEAGNLQWLCPPCNVSKGARPWPEFMQSRGFLL